MPSMIDLRVKKAGTIGDGFFLLFFDCLISELLNDLHGLVLRRLRAE